MNKIRSSKNAFRSKVFFAMAQCAKPRNHTDIPGLEQGCIVGTLFGDSALDIQMIEALTACQARGARAMLAWSVRALAKKSRISESSIRRIEIGFGIPENVSLDLRVKLQEYFEARGFVFTWSDAIGPGVSWNRTGKRERRSGAPDRRAGGCGGGE